MKFTRKSSERVGLELEARVVKWNWDRHLLSKGFDPTLELKMLSEEAREFYLAESLEHKLAEFADFLFVRYGTIAKYHGNLVTSAATFLSERESWLSLRGWMEDVEKEMRSLLIPDCIKAGVDVNKAIIWALKAVIANNELKGVETKDGKVIKNKIHTDPVTQIRRYLN